VLWREDGGKREDGYGSAAGDHVGGTSVNKVWCLLIISTQNLRCFGGKHLM
jgi:hypothetical protein